MNYYNEFDPKAAQWLRNLISGGMIPPGDVDERSITEVKADDLKGYTQCHFFAGIGGWSLALELAGWSANRPVWTGSCPCQPFSSAGNQKGKSDERHLWPVWFELIRECRPATIFGEQVSSAIAHGWLDDVYQGLEAEGYACGSAVLPACSVGAPHKRDRLWFVANSQREQTYQKQHRSSENERERVANVSSRCGMDCIESSLANTAVNGWGKGDTDAGRGGTGVCEEQRPLLGDSSKSNVANTELLRQSGQGQHTEPLHSEKNGNGKTDRLDHAGAGHWQDGTWINCPDGKQRIVEPSIPLLAHGVTARVAKLRAIGNAIVPQVAAEFIAAFDETL